MKETSEFAFTPLEKEPVAKEPPNWFRDFVCDSCRCFLSFLNGFITGLKMVAGSPVLVLPESELSYLRRSFTLGSILAGATCGVLLGFVIACVGCVVGEYMEDRSFGNTRSDSCRNGGCVGIFMGMSLMVGFVIRRLTYLRPKSLPKTVTKHSEIEEIWTLQNDDEDTQQAVVIFLILLTQFETIVVKVLTRQTQYQVTNVQCEEDIDPMNMGTIVS